MGNLLGSGRSGPQSGAPRRSHARLQAISCMGAEDAMEQYNTSIQGLVESEAESRLEQYGPNTVAREKNMGSCSNS